MQRTRAILCFVCLLCLLCSTLWVSVAMGQDSPNPESPVPSPGLTELETLKGENLQLKYDSLDKQMRLMQEQFLRLAEQQRQLIADLQALEAASLAGRGLKPEEWRVNWQARKIEGIEVRSQESEGKTEEEK